MLQEYIDGDRGAGFLKQMAMYATQAGDKAGAQMAANGFIVNAVPPFDAEDIRTISQFTTTTSDPGFKIMEAYGDIFRKALGEQAYTRILMNAIYQGAIAPTLDTSEFVDWDGLQAKTEAYGKAGEEILLRAKTIYYLNKQDRAHYKTTAREYLDKYGDHLKPEEKATLEEAMHP